MNKSRHRKTAHENIARSFLPPSWLRRLWSSDLTLWHETLSRGRSGVKNKKNCLHFPDTARSCSHKSIWLISSTFSFVAFSLLSVPKASKVYLRPSQYSAVRCKQFISAVRFSPFRSDEEGKTIISIPGIQHISNTFWRFSVARHRSIYRGDLLSLSRWI